MTAFAGNSLLGRMALDHETIDAASFTSIRLVSGALTLVLLSGFRTSAPRWSQMGSWSSGFLLFLYAAPFSFAYLSLSAGTGALILFGAVQVTMFASGLRAGERPGVAVWLGLTIAVGGLVALVSPGLSAPNPTGSLLMAIAGVAWGLYSLRGRGAEDPVSLTAANFVRASPFALLLSATLVTHAELAMRGVVLAAISGAIASGLGYTVWYVALRGLTATQAAIVQLSVPALAAVGGVWLLSEPLETRLVISLVARLGGIAVAITRGRTTRRRGVTAEFR